MLNNTITLSVDTANDGVVSDIDFIRFQAYTDKSIYIGPDHTSLITDQVAFYRTAAKPSGTSLGVEKRQIKITQTNSVPTSETDVSTYANDIATLQFSLPVGTSSASKKALRQRLIALLDDDSIMDSFMEVGEI